MSNEFYFETIKKTLIVFMSNFVDFTITRSNDAVINVPVVYGEKGKAYQELNDNRDGKVSIILPAMSIYNSDISPLPERQKNNLLKSIVSISQEHSDIMNAIGNPTPISFPMTLTIRTKYFSDMTRILEKIIPQFQPSKVIRINLIPEINLTVDIPVTLTGISKNTEGELSEDASSINIYEYDIEFDMVTYMFPPITEEHAVTKISMYTTDSQYDYSLDPDSVIADSVIQSITDYSSLLVKTTKIQPVDYDRTDIMTILDLSSELTEYGEKLKIINSNGVEVAYAYEYNDGSLYCSDEMLPSGSTLTKTGNIFINLSSLNKNVGDTLKIWTTHSINYNYAQNVLSIYNDFQFKNYNGLSIIGKTFSSLVYIYNNSMYIKSTGSNIDDITKVFAKETIQGDKHFEIKIESFDHENNKILCGISDGNGNFIYIRTSSTPNQYEIVELNNSIEIVVDNIIISSFNLIKFIYQNDNWKVYFDSSEIDLNISDDYNSMFITSNFTDLMIYDYIKGYKL